MEFSTCENCGVAIFFGRKTEGAGHHGGPNEWRHVDTQNMKCAGVVPHAKPPHETWMRVRVQEVGPLVKEGKWPFTKDKYWNPLTSEWKEAFRKAGFAPT
jgi:hypothetical protein